MRLAVALLVCCGRTSLDEPSTITKEPEPDGRSPSVEAGGVRPEASSVSRFQNGSFELGGNPCDDFNIPKGSTKIPGWTVSDGNIDWLGAPVPSCGWKASEGTNSIDLVGDQMGGVGGIEQTFATTAGTTYTVSFDLAGNYGAPPSMKPLVVTVDGVTKSYTFDTTGRGPFDMGWTTETFTFVANGASATLRFTSDISASGFMNAGAALDNVRVSP